MAQTIKLRRSGTSGAIPTTSQLELGEVAINTYDGKMYIKKNVGGTESIVEIGSGATSADAIFEEYIYTATSGQTSFSGSDDNSLTLSYTSGALQVFLNGVLLDPDTDYTATNGTTVVLTSGAITSDLLQIFAFKKKIGDGQTTVDTFTGNNSTTAFTLSLDPGDENNTRVYIDGVYQSKSNYSVSGTTLTFSTAPPTGTAIEVEIGNRVVTLDTLSDLDLPDNVKLRLGTSQDLQLYHDSSNSYIYDAGTGYMVLMSNGPGIRLNRASNADVMIDATPGGSSSLWYDGSKKIETTSTGATITGTLVADSVSVGDSEYIYAGDSNDFRIFHNGSGINYIQSYTSAELRLESNGNTTIRTNNNEDMAVFAKNGAVTLYYDNSSKIATTSTGVSVTGNIVTDGELRGPATFVIDPAAVGDNTGTVQIKGNLQVDGTQTIINSTTLTVDDLNIVLASGAANATAANGAGITIDGASATLTYGSTNDNWIFNKNVNVNGTITATGGELYLGAADSASAHINSYEVMTFNIDSDNDDTNRYFGWFKNGNSGSGTSLMRLIEDGKLLIGDTASHTDDLLQIETPASGGGHGIQIRRNDTNGDQNIGTITFGNNTATDLAQIKAKTDGDSNAGDSGALLFSTQVTSGSLTERMRIDSSGKVGIGTDDPGAKLSVYDGGISITTISGNGGQYFSLDNTHTGGRHYALISTNDSHGSLGGGDFAIIDFDVSGNDADRTRFLINSSGNVGIGGTSAINSKLSVFADGEAFRIDGTANTTRRIRFRNVGAGSGPGEIVSDGSLIIKNEDANAYLNLSSIRNIEYQVTSTNSTAGHHIFSSYNTEIMRIDGANNRVGIGTDSPAAKLHISGNSDVSDEDCMLIIDDVDGSSGSRIPAIMFRSFTSNTVTNQGRIRGTDTQGMVLSGSSALGDDLVVQSGGVGIGTSSINSDSILHLKSAQPNIYFEDTDDSKSWRLEAGAVFKLQNITTNSEVFRIDQSGNLLVGTQTTTAGNEGLVYFNGNSLRVTRDSNEPLNLDRLTTHGDIIEFRKDGSTVGRIGVATGPVSYIVLNDTTSDNVAALKGTSAAILPSTNAGADKNGTISLGSSSARFNNLSLAGTINTTGSSITVDPSSGDAVLFLQGASGAQTLRLDQNSIRTSTNTPITFMTNSSTVAQRILANGRIKTGIGVGTTDRNRHFTVEGSGDLMALYSTNDGAGGAQLDLIQDSSSAADDDAVGIINFSTDDRQYASIRGIAHSHSAGYGHLSFGVRTNTSTYNHNAMRIDENGNVGIGATEPTFTTGSGLRIERASNATLRLQDTGNHGYEIMASADDLTMRTMNNKPTRFKDASGNTKLTITNETGALSVGGSVLTNNVFRTYLITGPSSSAAFTRTVNVNTYWGFVAQGGIFYLGLHGWQSDIAVGAIQFHNNGSSSQVITGVSYHEMVSSSGISISVAKGSGDYDIDITFTNAHSNTHGWIAKVWA